MNKFLSVFLLLTLSACSAATVPFNEELSSSNSALVKNKKLDAILDIKTRETKILKIDGIDVADNESHIVSAGSHELLVSCQYWETLSLILTGTHKFHIYVKKGRTYILESALAVNQGTGKPTCYPVLEDQTKI